MLALETQLTSLEKSDRLTSSDRTTSVHDKVEFPQFSLLKGLLTE